MTIWNMEITASESPQTVHIPIEGKYYAIKNTGESDILVSSYVANPTEGADDVMKIPSGSSGVIPVKDGDLYVSAEEDGAYSVSIQDDKVIPWSGGTGSGGGSSDNTHYKGTTTTPLENGSTTNPIIIDGESYTAVFGDVVVYGYTEFVFDGTAWSEFGRPFDTFPTQGSVNAVTSNGIYRCTPMARGEGIGSAVGGTRDSSGTSAARGVAAFAYGYNVHANKNYMAAFGKNNYNPKGCLFAVGNGTSQLNRSNIVEVDSTSANVNGDIKINNVAIPIPYTTMPTITESMLGQIAMYVGATGGGFTQGCFYVASTDGAAEPTYSWVRIGGRTETVLWENTGTTNPDTIALSEAYTNFDEVMFCLNTNIANRGSASNTYLADDIIVGSDNLYGVELSAEIYVWYKCSSSTALALYVEGSQATLTKIVGIKY